MVRTIKNLGDAAVTSIEPFLFPPGSHNFTPPRTGYWKFVAWGAGQPANGGRSGAYFEKTVFLTVADSMSIVVGGGSTHTTLTFPDASVATAQSGVSGFAIASGGDINLDGSAGGSSAGNGTAGLGSGGGAAGLGDGTTNNGGGGAPAILPFRGGRGGNATTPHNGCTPGGGGAIGDPAGSALVLAFRVGN